MHLLYELKSRIIFLVFVSGLLASSLLSAKTIDIKRTNNFKELREEVLQIISKSQKRIWLSTDYLTDGDIVTALYFAKVRKLHVFVLLGSQKASSHMSRLNYLKQNNIPTYIKPSTLQPKAATLIYSDSRLYRISRDLNSYNKTGSAKISLASVQDLKTYKRDFIRAIKNPITARVKPIPLVGRARKHSYKAKPKRSNSYQRHNSAISPTGTYNYDKTPRSYRAPKGVNTSLPKVPKYLK